MKKFTSRIRIISLLAALLLLVLSSCGEKSGAGAEYSERLVYAMDTVIEIRASGASKELLDDCEALIYRLEKVFSATDPESELSLINSGGAGRFALSGDMLAVLEKSLELSALTGGAFDPALGDVISLWNIPNNGTFVPDKTEIAEALAHTDAGTLEIDGNTLVKTDAGLEISLGGIAKGYACQKAVELLSGGGSGYGIVSFGGNVGVYGSKPDGSKWKIAVKNPRDESAVVGYIYVDSGFVAVSGDYERYFELDGKRYHHIFDPSTGYPSESGIMSAAVWSEDGSAADGLSTALFVMGRDKALELYDSGEISFEAVLTGSDGTFFTSGLSDSFEPYDCEASDIMAES